MEYRMEMYVRIIPDDTPQEIPELPESPAEYHWWTGVGILPEEEYQASFPNGQNRMSLYKAIETLIQWAIEQEDDE